MAEKTPQQRLIDLLKDFSTGMLITRSTADTLHARPMAIAQIEPGGVLWFATDRTSGKIEDLRHDSHANVSLQGGGKFVSLSGTARTVDDAAKVDEVWSEEMRVWFPGGKQDPRLTLLCFEPHEGEFWDNSGTNAIKYLFKAGAAYLRGERPTDDETEHGKVAMPASPAL